MKRDRTMPHVLIVEDNLMIADVLQQSLEKSGYSVSGIARTVDEALRSAERDPPDFAVIDLGLADGDFGGDVASELRKTSSLGIIFSTGSEDVVCTSLCGDALMVKPYRLSDVAVGLRIIQEMADLGETKQALPRNFRLLAHRP
jgi:DNA-binding response OmpR family regulator